jgi:hypothetical protein
MRVLVLVLAAALAACSSTTFAQPRVLVSPYLAVYQLRGKVGVQSQPTPGGPLQDNPAQSMVTFGQDHHREDVGVRADIGDGFAGVRFDYYKLDMGTSKTGVLTADWGRLRAGDTVRMEAEMDELRIGYLESLGTLRASFRGEPLTFRFAGGGVFAYRDMTLRARTDDGARTQNVGITGDVIYLATRFRASWRDVAFDAEYAISPDLVLGGDFQDVLQDVELRASYTLQQHDISFFGGWRWSTLKASGSTDGFGYDADLKIDGFQFGVSLSF